jgi:hypothetical protein
MEIPTYIKNPNQENYNELFNQTLRNGLSDNGWTVPQVTAAKIVTLAAIMPIGTLWYDTTNNKLVVNTPTGTQTITSA